MNPCQDPPPQMSEAVEDRGVAEVNFVQEPILTTIQLCQAMIMKQPTRREGEYLQVHIIHPNLIAEEGGVVT